MGLTDLPAAAGVSLKPEYFADVDSLAPGDIWFEVHPENYVMKGGPRLEGLLAAAERFPISLHGVGASLGGPVRTPKEHVNAIRGLIDVVDPAAVSEHAVWSRSSVQYYADLLPLPRTAEALWNLVDGIDHFQTGIGRQILIENPTNYLSIASEMDEPDFLVEAAARTGCGLLLDVNNLYLSARNCGTDAEAYIEAIPPGLVGEIHIAGHKPDEHFGESLLIDTHDAPVADEVWGLLDLALRHLGTVPVLIERDAELPPFSVLLGERDCAQRLIKDVTIEEVADA